ncbi:hypothetical protein LR48_Vigan148s001000 [Vigna angularis]|uniref:RING-type E3 ubiquitin transferase n=1 Tax=Phaseolus angularis TaxID=3914 RepID=A0A0L9T5M6_PHAAN|nr:hypothetical protein LR48_Vigan148s001000 [Vigna angularis]
MTSLGNTKSLVPYMNNKDCSQGFCSLYCPQWCYVIYPPPPPFEFPADDSSPNFSPLVIAVIGVLASAFLLVSYYTLISKYCGSRESSQSEDHEENVELEDDHNPSLHEPWHAPTIGLDEALIKSITVCKYKKGNGLVEVTDCPVCLSEFEDDESVRLLPKCSHAFHLPCIDMWLKSHSSCPLCRASIFTFNAAAIHVATPVIELTALRALSDLGNLRGRHSVIEIRDEEYDSIRRTVSMDHSFQRGNGLSVADVLHLNQEREGCSNGAGPSKGSRGESSKSSHRRRVLHYVLSPITMKRSFSSGRFSLSRNGRGRQWVLPV